MGLSSWSNLWIYLVGDFAGGAVAAGAFKVLNPAERDDIHRPDLSDQPEEQTKAA